MTAGSGLDQDLVEEGCIVSMPGGCSLIKPKYMQPRAGAKRDPSLLSNGPATGDEGKSLSPVPDEGGWGSIGPAASFDIRRVLVSPLQPLGPVTAGKGWQGTR